MIAVECVFRALRAHLARGTTPPSDHATCTEATDAAQFAMTAPTHESVMVDLDCMRIAGTLAAYRVFATAHALRN